MKMIEKKHNIKLLILTLILSIFISVSAYSSTTSIINLIFQNPLIPKNVGSSLRDLAGYNGKRQYLILFADSAEPRPICGFTGWFAIVSLYKGNLTTPEIKAGEKAFGRTYAIDQMLKKKILAPMPASVFSKWWGMRDSFNWPDYPYSAIWAKRFFDWSVNSGLSWKSESLWPNSLKKIDGVVVVSSEGCKEFLKTTGNIKVGELEASGSRYNFNAIFKHDNFDFLINYYSNRFNMESGFPGYNLITALFNELYDQAYKRLNTSNPVEKVHLMNYILKMLNQKNIVIYSTNPSSENALKFLGWGGEIKNHAGDFLGVFDSHGSYSTRIYSDRKVYYSVTIDKNGRVKGRTEISYTNKGKMPTSDSRMHYYNTRTFDSYVKILVPKYGKYLRSSYRKTTLFVDSNLMDQKPSFSHRGPHMGLQFNKTFLGGWIRVLPFKTGKIWFEYLLPKNLIKINGKNKTYGLLLQKQPGVRTEEFWFTFYIPRNAKIVKTSIKPFKKTTSALIFKLNSQYDRKLSIVYR